MMDKYNQKIKDIMLMIRTVCIAISTVILVVGFIISFVTILPEFPTRTFIKSIADEAMQTVTTVIVEHQGAQYLTSGK